MTVTADSPELRHKVALACRILSHRGLVDGILGHVSVRVAESELLVRCRTADEPGLGHSSAAEVFRATLDGAPVDVPEEAALPNELPIHTELMRRRPEVGCVIHAHPRAALLSGLARLELRAVFGAYNIPAMRLAIDGVPIFPRPVLITRPDLAAELVDVMADRPACLMIGHGITVAASTIEQATVLAVNLNALLEVTVELARLQAEPPEVSSADLAELPDLGSAFNDTLVWNSLVAELPELGSAARETVGG